MKGLYDICIVGAGVAGASIAAHLANKNLNIALLDLSFEERDRIVGELMQPGGVYMMKQLGLESVLNNISTCEINGYVLFNKEKEVLIDYDTQGDFEGVTGRGLNNGQFVQSLRKAAAQDTNVQFIKGKVLDFIEMDEHVEGVIYEEADGTKKSLLAKLTIVCDGFFSSLRSKLIPDCKEVTSHFMGMVLENCVLPHEQYGHIFMGGTAPFLCYRISKEQVRLLVDFPGSEPPPKGEDLLAYLNTEVKQQLPENMHESLAQAILDAKFKFMPNHYMHSRSCTKTGLAMVGDALNMRHPLTGGGMTATLTDVMLLCKAILKDDILLEGKALNVKIEKYYEDRITWNASINILADALYKVSLNPLLKEACFNYLAKGDAYSKQPLELLAGISRDNATLYRHFVQVAMLGAKDNLTKAFGFKSLDNSYVMLKDASLILLPLVKNEKFLMKDLISNKSINQLASA